MPAELADIAAGTRRSKIETWQNAAIKARYPNARDGGAEPAEGMFDAAADAQAAIAQRAELFGVERRRFNVPVQDLLRPDPAAGLPIIRLKDAEQVMDGKTLPARIECNLERTATAYEVFG